MIKSKDLAKSFFQLAKEDTPDLVENFLKFAKENKLEAQLPSVLYRVEKLAEQDRETNGIQIETAHAVSKGTIDKIKSFLKAEDLKDYHKINKDILAGFRAKWGGKAYDASFHTSLKKLEHAITR